MQAKCQLPYPDRYDRALHFYNAWPQDAQQPSQDTQLILYGLSSQVAHGPCRDPQPSSWNTLEHAKWTAWRGLKDMDKLEAMRLFVKTLEEDEVPHCTLPARAVLATAPCANPEHVVRNNNSVPLGWPVLRIARRTCWQGRAAVVRACSRAGMR